MENYLKFFENIQTLKEKKRRGWLVHGIENSESTAAHIFRMAVSSWVLGKKGGLNTEKLLKLALIHDICEVFAFDETPYDPLLPKKIDTPQAQEKIKKILQKWPTFSFKEKREKTLKKNQRENQAFKRLIKDLPVFKKRELEMLWQEFQEGLSQEARFASQLDKAENFLQGLEYWERYGRIQKELWVRWAKEIFDDPLLIEFEKAIERRFLGEEKREGELDKILDFLIEIGKLKEIKRERWVLRKVPNPETIADHCFSLALMGWILTKKDEAKIIKMALSHKFSKVLIPEFTPYDSLLPNLRQEIKQIIEEPLRFSKKEREKVMKELKKILKRWPKFSQKFKERIFKKEYKKEKKSFQKVISPLPFDLQREMIEIWQEFKEGASKEGKFLHQVKKIESLLQALRYWKQDKDFPIEPWLLEIKEKIDHPILLDFLETLFQFL